jgi:uncharacterized peroxidase-related enzyme
MAFVEVIGPSEATGRLQKLYQQVSGPNGQVDNVLQVHSLRPHTLEGHMALYKSVLHHRSNHLPEWFLEVIGVYVSRINACSYCDRHHTAGLKKLLHETELSFDELNRALSEPVPGEPFDSQQQAVLAYVALLTRDSAAITQDHINHLRAEGLGDGEILEINQVAAYFAYANRTVSGLGVNIDGEQLGLSPSSGEGVEAWRHD